MVCQGADHDFYYGFDQFVVDLISSGSRILNLGSGIVFNFERLLSEQKKVYISSCDIVPPANKPCFINDFIVQSVEEEIKFNKGGFDVVTFFELIEHIDKTDVLLRNCHTLLKDDGRLIFSFPNLASVYARVELLLGFQPHILEVSNERSDLGTGFFGRLNCSWGTVPLHHIRGITYKAMRGLLSYHGFFAERIVGFSSRFWKIFKLCPSLAPVVLMVCRKKSYARKNYS